MLRAAIASALHGNAPLAATEAGRRSIPLDLRPSFDDLIKQLRRQTIPRKAAAVDAPGAKAPAAQRA